MDLANSYKTSSPFASLEKLVLQGHIRLGLKANAGAEDVSQGAALLGQGVDDGGPRRGQRGLEHVAEDAQDAMEALVLLGAGIGGAGLSGLPLDAGHHFGDDDEVDDQRRGEEGVLADVEEAIWGNALVKPQLWDIWEEKTAVDWAGGERRGRAGTHEIVWWPPMKISA